MTYYIRNGSAYTVTSDVSMDIHQSLPAANFTVKYDQRLGHFLELSDPFPAPSKIYGECLNNTDRIIRTFMERDISTGVLFSGEKGSGKTLLAKNIVIELQKLGVPCIIINTAFTGDDFNKFIQRIDQRCVIMFDEFEKVYDEDGQTTILTLLDGVYPSNKLFILTCNDKWRIDKHMINRPGRMFYMIEFRGLSVEFIREYCEDNLNNKEYIEQICKISSMFAEFNFDMLKALVEEMNRYNEAPHEALTLLNVKAEYSGNNEYSVELFINYEGTLHKINKIVTWCGNIMMERLHFDYNMAENNSLSAPSAKTETESGDKTATKDFAVDSSYIGFEPSDIIRVDPDTNSYEFRNTNGRVILTKVPKSKFNVFNAF